MFDEPNYDDPRAGQYAEAWRGGPWGALLSDKDVTDRTATMSIEFQPGSDRLGGFTWVAGQDCLISAELQTKLAQLFSGWRPLPVVVMPTEKYFSKKPIVPYPYSGPVLSVLWIDHFTAIDIDKSTFIEWNPRPAGQPGVEFHGIEEIISNWDEKEGDFVSQRHPREPGMGIFIHNRELQGHDLFRIRAWRGVLMCTDRFRDFVLEEGLTNIDFFEVGDVI